VGSDDSDFDIILVDTDKDSLHNQLQRRPSLKKAARKHALRNGPIAYPFEVLDHWPQFNLRPGKIVELQGKEDRDGDFVRIQDIILNPTKDIGNISLRGQLLCRAKYVGGFVGTARVGGQTVGGKMKRDLNELALLFQVDKDDPRPSEEQSLVTVSLAEVLRVRQVIFTHEEFPLRSFRETTTLNRSHPNHDHQKQIVKDTGVLVCRYAFTEFFKDACARLSPKKCTEASLVRVFISNSDFPSTKLTSSLNGSKSTLDMAGHRAKRACRNVGPVKKKKMTYGSGCCGAGGDCLGARWGGAHVKYGWDHDESACQSARRNHPRAKIYCREAEDFPRKGEDDTCDILHLSWPCDYFSPNHTHEGKNDDANISALFGTYQKLMSAQPRVHTQENTFGINSHHPEFLGALIQEIVRAGYNVRWKVDQFADHGSPASRKRLVIIASK
jgi:DNA (cytosine-5)-methyltransferase 1